MKMIGSTINRNTPINGKASNVLSKCSSSSEGNADNAGRTVFTGFRTNSQLTFTEDERETTYQISQKFSYQDIEERSYFSGSIEVPTTLDEVTDTTELDRVSKEDYIVKDNYERIRLAYDSIDAGDTITLKAYQQSGGSHHQTASA